MLLSNSGQEHQAKSLDSSGGYERVARGQGHPCEGGSSDGVDTHRHLRQRSVPISSHGGRDSTEAS